MRRYSRVKEKRLPADRPDRLFVKSRKTRGAPCPSCGKVLDGVTGAATEPTDTIPRAGLVSVCVYCGQLLVFTETGLDAAPAEALAAMPQWQREVIEGTIKRPIKV